MQHVLSGISFGFLLFLISSGLTLTFGLMRLLNLAHGAMYMVAAYIAIELLDLEFNYWVSMALTVVLVGLFGMLFERLLLHRFLNQILPQIVITVGAALIIGDLILAIYKGNPILPPKPPGLDGATEIFGVFFPKIRLALIGVGLAVSLVMWFVMSRTRVGAMVRAAVDDEQIARSVGIPVPRLFIVVFGIGAGLVAFAGVWGGAFSGLSPGIDSRMLLLAVVIVVVGGLGSLKGAFVASLLVGLTNQFGIVFFPQFAQFALFAPVALFLAFRPQGLFGKVGVE
ncbi:MAG: branched-chain amino acid ABC transporter permease [Acidimicrobiia bacterium]